VVSDVVDVLGVEVPLVAGSVVRDVVNMLVVEVLLVAGSVVSVVPVVREVVIVVDSVVVAGYNTS
jgi:hypothetical protein